MRVYVVYLRLAEIVIVNQSVETEVVTHCQVEIRIVLLHVVHRLRIKIGIIHSSEALWMGVALQGKGECLAGRALSVEGVLNTLVEPVFPGLSHTQSIEIARVRAQAPDLDFGRIIGHCAYPVRLLRIISSSCSVFHVCFNILVRKHAQGDGCIRRSTEDLRQGRFGTVGEFSVTALVLRARVLLALRD